MSKRRRTTFSETTINWSQLAKLCPPSYSSTRHRFSEERVRRCAYSASRPHGKVRDPGRELKRKERRAEEESYLNPKRANYGPSVRCGSGDSRKIGQPEYMFIDGNFPEFVKRARLVSSEKARRAIEKRAAPILEIHRQITALDLSGDEQHTVDIRMTKNNDERHILPLVRFNDFETDGVDPFEWKTQTVTVLFNGVEEDHDLHRVIKVNPGRGDRKRREPERLRMTEEATGIKSSALSQRKRVPKPMKRSLPWVLPTSLQPLLCDERSLSPPPRPSPKVEDERFVDKEVVSGSDSGSDSESNFGKETFNRENEMDKSVVEKVAGEEAPVKNKENEEVEQEKMDEEMDQEGVEEAFTDEPTDDNALATMPTTNSPSIPNFPAVYRFENIGDAANPSRNSKEKEEEEEECVTKTLRTIDERVGDIAPTAVPIPNMPVLNLFNSEEDHSDDEAESIISQVSQGDDAQSIISQV